MTWLWFILLAAGVLYTRTLQSEKPWARSLFYALVALTLVSAFIRIGAMRRAARLPTDRAREQALGRVTAQLVADRSGPARVAVIIPLAVARGWPAAGAETRLRAFRAAAREAGLEIVAEISPLAHYESEYGEDFEYEDGVTPVELLLDVGVNYTALKYAAAQHPDVEVIVCIDGVPIYGVGRQPGLDSRRVIAVDVHRLAPEWVEGLRAGQFEAIIARRREPVPPPVARRPTARDIFDQHYIIVTAEHPEAARKAATGSMR